MNVLYIEGGGVVIIIIRVNILSRLLIDVAYMVEQFEIRFLDTDITILT